MNLNSLPIPSHTTSNLPKVVEECSKASLYFFARYVLDFRDLRQELHLPFCNYIQMLPENGGPPESLLKMAYMSRGHLKSSICSVAFPLWLLIHDRNRTIALFSAKMDHPKKWLKQIKNIIETNPWFKMAFPYIRPAMKEDSNVREKWDQEEILLERDPSWSGDAQSSITCASIASGQASQHWGYIIIDDPVNEKMAKAPDSDLQIQAAVDTYKYMWALGRGWGRTGRLLVGTPYGRGDVLSYARDFQVATGQMLLWGIGARGEFEISESLKDREDLLVDLPLGEPILPGLVPEEMLQQIEHEDIEKYYLQYLCKPYDLGRNGFDLDLIRSYAIDESYNITCGCHSLHKHNLEDMSVVGVCDPAASPDKKACKSAIGIIAKGKCGCRFLLDEWQDRVDPFYTVDKIKEMCEKWSPYLQVFAIESVGFQRMLRGALEEAQGKGEIPIHVRFEDLKPDNRNKDARIKSQQTPVANGQWHVLPKMRLASGRENMLWELSLWPYGRVRDTIDAILGYCDDAWAFPQSYQPYDREVELRDEANRRHDAVQRRAMLGVVA